jgi:hypothetical protein
VIFSKIVEQVEDKSFVYQHSTSNLSAGHRLVDSGTMGDNVPSNEAQINGNSPEPKTSTPGLSSLQSAEKKRLYDVIEDIRDFDIYCEIELPQLVVCGKQSAGKSSVLEAISEIPFPRKDGICTRFATV